MQDTIRVLTRFPLATDTAGAKELPRRMKILDWGENRNAFKRPVVVGRMLLERLADPDCPFSTVALDFEHNTCPGTRAYEESAEPRPVAGYGRLVCEEGKGVYIEMERWTPEGEKMAHHYEDLSATPVLDKAGNVLAIASVALCRTGAVPGITFSPSPLSSPPTPTTQPQEKHTMDFKAILLEILGLPADASDEAIAAAVEDKKKKSAAPQPEPEGGVAPLAARIDALEKRANEAEKAGILAEARAAGKVVALSADALAALTPAQLKETVDATPVTVPLSATMPAAVKEQPAPAAVDPEVGRIFALCGAEPPKPEAKA